MLIALPLITLVIGGLTWLAYTSTVSSYRNLAVVELRNSNDANYEALAREIRMIAETHRKASADLGRRLSAGSPPSFGRFFAEADDGAYHTYDDLWDGRRMADGSIVSGMGGFVAPGATKDGRDKLSANAFATLIDFRSGLPSVIESLYFYTPQNDLLMFAPRRGDKLSFYRTAPADFEFQNSELGEIVSSSFNPGGEMRCTSLQKPIYDQSGSNWTTGCMTPFEFDGARRGAWGTSIPLTKLVDNLRAPPPDARTVIVSRDGKLIHDSRLVERQGSIEANSDLSSSGDALLKNIPLLLERGGDLDGFSSSIDSFIVARDLETPDWVVLTALPRSALAGRAWKTAREVILAASLGIAILAMLLAVIFDRTVASKISRLANRATSISSRGFVVRDDVHGNEIQQLEQAFDAMERRLEEEKFKERRSFDTIIDAANDFVMVLFDDNGTIVRSNQGAKKLIGERGLKILASMMEAKFLGASRTLESKPPQISDRTVWAGKPLWLEEAILPLEDNDGNVFGTAFIAHDVTHQLKAQIEIEKNLKYLELGQTSAGIGHFALDLKNDHLIVSDWIAGHLGVSQNSLTVREAAQFIAKPVSRATRKAFREAIIARDDFTIETTLCSVDGFIDVAVSGTIEEASPFKDGLKVLGIVRDVSAEKASERALRQATEEAQAEATARSNLLAVVSHEIRTPVSGILGLIEQMRRDHSQRDKERALALIEDSAEALLTTLDSTLQRMRSERETVSESKEEFEPRSLVERVAELFRPLARRKGLLIEMASDAGSVSGYPARIQQILANLASNAIKFTAKGKVCISCRHLEGTENLWEFVVSDTGTGIKKDRLARIFHPFAGSNADTLGRHSGSGLGLSISRELARDMDGELEALSDGSTGTRMILTLPLDDVISHSDKIECKGKIALKIKSMTLAIKVEAVACELGFETFELAPNSVDGEEAVCEIVNECENTVEVKFSSSSYRFENDNDLIAELPGLLREACGG
ncbi:ATP-binding protein [Erythrobacter litoralis]|uniref:ATP-binding protein n=1 Tax=Erythrobacter litoralis TaxID=39960 RepID=UPI002434AA42|nr:ATP-binding protein [Erythrobacter litoralis]